MKKASDRYLKIVEWSEEDRCYVGTCPGLMLGGVHGSDEVEVYHHLCAVVDEWISTIQSEGVALPEPTAGRTYSGKFVLRTGPSLHNRLSIEALRAGKSLNAYCVETLERAIDRGPKSEHGVRGRTHRVV